MKTKPLTTLTTGFGIVLLTTLLAGSCASGPEPIRYGQDACYHCKMTLTDKRFGAEIITDKGKVLKFDDLNCVVAYLKEKKIEEKDLAQIVSIDFKRTGEFVDINKAFLLKNDAIKSPMRSDIACFSDNKDLESVKGELGGGKVLTWAEVKAEF